MAALWALATAHLGWRALLGGRPRFFLAPNGLGDPQAELVAQLRGLFSRENRPDEHPRCRFPARTQWLIEQLSIDVNELPTPNCPKLDRFFVSVNGETVSVIFSSYYLSNAASAFGHTLLRINKPRGNEEKQELLDTGINFSATVDTQNSVLYALKGLTGLFEGHFQRLPYYYKVREYNDFESRDLWEYQLALTPKQVKRLIAHLWELGSTFFDYYYLSENCSYHLLAALEVAEPKLHLLNQLSWPVLPADTIKALFANPGLVSDVRYRPSLREQFRTRYKRLTDEEKNFVADLQKNSAAIAPPQISKQRRAAAIDTAVDQTDMTYGATIIDTESKAAKHRFALVSRRAQLGVTSEDMQVAVPRSKAPHLGHDSRRIGLSAGARDGQLFSSLHYRLALHDLADASTGFPDLAQIEFLPTSLRFVPETKQLRIEAFRFVDIVNLVPWRRYERGVSWSFTLGGQRHRNDGCNNCFVSGLDFAAGSTLSTDNNRFAIFAMSATRALWHPRLAGLGWNTRLELGALGGMRWRVSERITAVTRGRYGYRFGEERRHGWSSDTTIRVATGNQLALSYRFVADFNALEHSLGLLFYY